MNQLLVDSPELFDTLVQEMKDYAIFLMHPDGRIATWNAGARLIFGFDNVEICGQHFATLFTVEDVESRVPERELETAASTGRAEDKRWHQRQDGSRFYADGVTTSIRDADGSLRGFAKICRNATEQKKAEDERTRLLLRERETSREKDEFLAVVSHELRTPMTSILGWVQLLRIQKESEPELLESALESIETGAQMQARILEDALELSRLRLGKLQVKRRSMNLLPIVRAAVTTLRPQAQEKRLELNVVADRDEYCSMIDAMRIHQIIWNLGTNAVKFTGEGGSITVSLHHEPGFARIDVTDTGRGIKPEFLSSIFERFRQAEDNEHGGLGVGLSIVRDLVELHEGTVHVVSSENGSIFSVRLPLIAP